jgi:hypothetical protein
MRRGSKLYSLSGVSTNASGACRRTWTGSINTYTCRCHMSHSGSSKMSRVTQRQQQQDVTSHTAAAAARCHVSHSGVKRVAQLQQQQDVACHTAAAAARCHVSHSCSSTAAGVRGRGWGKGGCYMVWPTESRFTPNLQHNVTKLQRRRGMPALQVRRNEAEQACKD